MPDDAANARTSSRLRARDVGFRILRSRVPLLLLDKVEQLLLKWTGALTSIAAVLTQGGMRSFGGAVIACRGLKLSS